MSQSWQSVWGGRKRLSAEEMTLERLMACDGFGPEDVGAITVDTYVDYVHYVTGRLGLTPGDSVYEVGCGSGAFLYPLYHEGYEVAGTDYADVQIANARAAMPGGVFGVIEAARIDDTQRYDAVIASGVFLYFEDEAYAATVLQKMVRMARKGVAVLDVSDLAKRDEAIRLRQQAMTPEEYAAKYAGLDHLYLPQTWFAERLAGLPLRVEVEPQRISGFLHSAYRYNVFILPANG